VGDRIRDPDLRSLRKTYAAALETFLAGAGEESLARAYDLGRGALGGGVGVLGLIAVHEEAVAALVRGQRISAAGARLLSASGTFLAESLSPFEMTHRGYEEVVVALRSMNQRLEDEARRIAHALHDDAGQMIASVHLGLEAATTGLPARARARFDRVRGLLDEVERHLRRLSHELRPTILDDLGLLPAIEFLARGVAERSGIPIRVTGAGRRRLRPAVETALYRVVQEALRNAVRHASATGVVVRLDQGTDGVLLMVRDDGRGFDVGAVLRRRGARGLGLIAMRERLNEVGGVLAIKSAPGRGTEIRISIPLEESRDADSTALGG
jgi:signal transduction histidine kinase